MIQCIFSAFHFSGLKKICNKNGLQQNFAAAHPFSYKILHSPSVSRHSAFQFPFFHFLQHNRDSRIITFLIPGRHQFEM